MTMTMTMLQVEGMRQLRNPYTLAFTLAMPVAMYLLFGATAEYGHMSAGNGNVAFYVMASMGAYGTAVAMSSLTSLAATEANQGWGRQLAMTPLRTTGYALTKITTAVSFALLATGAVFVTGLATGAKADHAGIWLGTLALALVVGMMFGLFGLGVGLFFNGDAAVTLASISITFFAFFGNVFMPLDGTMLDIARYTPMYGFVALARWPLTEGTLTTGQQDSLWLVLLNIVVWTALFAALAAAGAKRARSRR